MRTTNDPQPIGALFPGAVAVMVGAEARLVALINRVAAPAPPTRRPLATQARWDLWLAERQAGLARPCCHPLSCLACGRTGFPCGQHTVGMSGHERCTGRDAVVGGAR